MSRNRKRLACCLSQKPASEPLAVTTQTASAGAGIRGRYGMHSNLDLILTLTGGLAAALAFGYGTQRLGLSPIVGYLLAGIAVGPNTPGFVANRELADQLAE